MRRIPAALCLSLVMLAPSIVAAQARIVSTKDSSGTPMDVVGLRRWSVQMIEDSIAKYAPGESMRSHACQAVLQYKLGFPSASVVHYMLREPDGKESNAIVVTLVEPQDSGRLSWRRVTAPAKPRLAAWRDLYAPVSARWDTTKPPEVAVAYVQGLIQDIALARVRTRTETQRAAEDVPPTLRDSFAAFTERLARRASAADLALARATLEGDGRVENRIMAVAVLTNFPERDDAWHALIGAAMDREESVRGAAAAALANMTRGRKLTVDWRPVVPELRAILGGTGVGTIPPLLDALVATNVTPEVATAIVVGNADYVLAQASLTLPSAAWGAKRFLGHASGKKQASVAEWEAWLQAEETKSKASGA